MAQGTLRPVHMFWHGPQLSRIERLCMTSFVANGHPVHLHVYEEPAALPGKITLENAAAILPRDLLFAHAQTRSFAVFADWFRYRLLHERGGLWVDTDVVCLRPFDHSGEEIFGWEDERLINNAVLGLPKGHALAAWMAERCESPNRLLPFDSLKTRRRKLVRRLLGRNSARTTTWGETGPAGLTAAARHLRHADRALPFWHFYPIHHLNWRSVFDSSLGENTNIVGGSYGLHLWNEMTRADRSFDKNAHFPADSLFERLCARYDVA